AHRREGAQQRLGQAERGEGGGRGGGVVGHGGSRMPDVTRRMGHFTPRGMMLGSGTRTGEVHMAARYPLACPLASLAVAVALATGTIAPAALAADGGYRQPPEPLLSTMRAPLPPALRIDPTGTTMLELQRTQYPPIARVAE